MTGQAPFAWLAEEAHRRTVAGLHRALVPRAADRDVLDLASNDYLGLARDPRVVEAGVTALRTWGAGSTGSRLVTGSTQLHAELEAELAAFLAAPRALVFSSGYAANLGALSALSGPGALVVSDAGNHASIVDACRVSRARVAVVGHRDVAAVRAALAARSEPRALVVTDSVFSVDGDLAPLAGLHAACRDYGALLVVDEAHGLGVRGPGGRGLVHEAGLSGAADVVRTVTLSKSLGSQGGAVVAAEAVVEHLVDVARTFIFDTGLAPPAAGAALGALRVLRAEPERAALVRDRATRLAASIEAAPPTSAIVSVILGEPGRAVRAAQECLAYGVHVGCFRPPSVPAGTSRLRLTARATLSDADIARAFAVLDAVLGAEPAAGGDAVGVARDAALQTRDTVRAAR